MKILMQYWEVIITHTYREGNSCADWMENFDTTLHLDTHRLTKPSLNVLYVDVLGVSKTRHLVLS